MKKLFILCSSLLVLTLCLLSCSKGETSQRISGDEYDLPTELKGLKIYSVYIGKGDQVKVAILDNKINSLTYSEGKTSESIIIINKTDGKSYQIKNIISENDSIIVARK